MTATRHTCRPLHQMYALQVPLSPEFNSVSLYDQLFRVTDPFQISAWITPKWCCTQGQRSPHICVTSVPNFTPFRCITNHFQVKATLRMAESQISLRFTMVVRFPDIWIFSFPIQYNGKLKFSKTEILKNCKVSKIQYFYEDHLDVKCDVWDLFKAIEGVVFVPC